MLSPEQRARFDAMGRTSVLEDIQDQTTLREYRESCREWISEDDRAQSKAMKGAARDARLAMYAAWAAAVIAIIAVIISLFK